MSDVLATNLGQARALADALASAGDAVEPPGSTAQSDGSLHSAAGPVADVQIATSTLLGRLADRCRSLSLGVDAAADHTARADT